MLGDKMLQFGGTLETVRDWATSHRKDVVFRPTELQGNLNLLTKELRKPEEKLLELTAIYYNVEQFQAD